MHYYKYVDSFFFFYLFFLLFIQIIDMFFYAPIL